MEVGGQLVPVRAMNIYGGGGGVHPLILNLGAIWKWVVNFIPPSACSQRKNPCTRYTGGWVGPITGLDVSEVTCNNFPISEPGSSSP